MSFPCDRSVLTNDAPTAATPKSCHRPVRLLALTALVAVLVLASAVAGALPSPALAQEGPESAAATFVVNTLNDLPDVSPGNGVCETDVSGQCSLRAAIMEANALAGPDTIGFGSLTGVITLDGAALPMISADLIIDGPANPTDIVVDAAGDDRHLVIAPGATVEIARVHFTNGSVAEGSGGSIFNSGRLTLSEVIISNSHADGDGGAVYGASLSTTIIRDGSQIGLPDLGNSAGYGGGVANAGKSSLVVNDSSISYNWADFDGGGVYGWSGVVEISNGSLIKANSAADRGGGLYNNGFAYMEIISSTVAYNSADQGGGIYNYYSTLNLTNSTVSGNSALGDGGGIYEESIDTLYLYNTTISDNTADQDTDGVGNGGGLFLNGFANSSNSILAGNADLTPGTLGPVHPDCSAWPFSSFTANEYNVVGNNAGCVDHFVNGVSGNQVGTAISPLDPVLGPLNSDYGALLHALLAGSPALNGGDPDGCLDDGNVLITVDQRGLSRPQNEVCDAGAFEAAWPVIYDQSFDVLEFSPNGTVVGVVEADDPNSSSPVSFAITGGNGTGGGAFAISGFGGQLVVADSSQLDPAVTPVFTLTVVVTNSILLTDTASVYVDVLGDPLIVRNTNDTGDGSLRNAILYVNELPTSAVITFDIPGPGPHVITPLSPLPVLAWTAIINATTQPEGQVILDGSLAGPDAQGLEIEAWVVDVRGLTINNFSGNGILVSQNPKRLPEGGPTRLIENNVIDGNEGSGILVVESDYIAIHNNVITGNAGDGVTVVATANVPVRNNSIHDNGKLGIDLDGDGVTANDVGDSDTGANDLQNFPVLLRAIPDGEQTIVEGRLNSTASQDFDLQFFVNDQCDPTGFGEGQLLIGGLSVVTDEGGNARFVVELPVALADGQFITALAIDESGNTSEFSQCIVTGPGNDSWPRAFRMTLEGGADAQTAAINHYVDKLGQSRWYKFEVEPDSQVTIELDSLPENYDIVVYKDIAEVYASLVSPQNADDLHELGAEFAPDMFTPDMFTPDMFTPDMFTPDMFTPDMFTPDMFTPDMFTPDMFTPDMFTPDMFTPDMFTPDEYGPNTFDPDNFDPSVTILEPQAYASAQNRSIIAFSAINGLANERAVVNTWTNSSDFYVRVRGRNGVFSLDAPFQLNVTIQRGLCQSLDTTLVPTSLAGVAGGFKTIILLDRARLEETYDPDEITVLLAKLQTLADRPEVQGVLVDVSLDARVSSANLQANAKVDCPQAKNLVADSIKQVVQRYRGLNPLEYVVIVGNDDIIPFFRTPDRALLAAESNYVPPVFNQTASQASLKLDYVLTQDEYGSSVEVSLQSHYIPVPDLAVGRLVETPADMMTVLDAYLATADGVVSMPDSAFVSGYDFLTDAAEAVQAELEAGIGEPANTLIAPRGQAPLDPNAWTGQQLKDAFLGQRHDLVLLAGHFSASTALAADYQTRMTTDDVLASPVDMTNMLIFSIGCHSGYNIVNSHGVPLVTREPDWAQAFAMKGATFIGGTGYQYGHTDFIAYSEQLYLNFARQLRYGTGPVSVGQALVVAKQTYLADTPILRGIDEKSLLEATLFGLPMLRIDLPTGRIDPPIDPPVVGAITGYGVNPGLTLGLSYADLPITTTLVTATRTLSNTNDLSQSIEATYLEGADALMLNPLEPVLPLIKRNVNVPGTVLRGIGFRGGVYSDLFDVVALTSAPATEIRGIQFPFRSSAFYPIRAWNANYYDALANGPIGITRLMVVPAQFKGNGLEEIDGTLRSYSGMDFRLFYSDNLASFPETNTPALAAPPAIVQVSSITSTTTITLNARVTSDPAVGVQEVWASYTGATGPFYGSWQSLDLAQDPLDSTLWSGALVLPGGQNWQDVRFIVQAVNGVGLVSMVTNFGDYFVPGVDPGQSSGTAQPTSLALLTPPTSGPYGTPTTFTVQLTEAVRSGHSGGTGVANQLIEFGLGSQRRRAVTDIDGFATVTFPLVGLVQEDLIRVSFGGSNQYQPSAVQAPFEIVKQTTSLEVEPAPAVGQYSDDTNLLATLIAGDNRRLQQRTVFYVIGDLAETLSATSTSITDITGRALAGPVNLPAGAYPVTVYFLGTIPVGGGQTVTLEDTRFLASTGAGSLAQSAEDATVTYTGATVFLSGKATDVTALVVQADDGMPGDLALAQVRFVVRDGANQVVADVTGNADANGNATASVPALNAGSYTLTVKVVGGFFTSRESEPVDIQVMPPTAVTLRELDAQGGEPAGAWLMGLLAAAALVLAALVVRRTRTLHGA